MSIKQLEMIAKLEREKEDQLSSELVKARQFLVDNQNKLEDIRQYRIDYLHSVQERGRQGIGGNNFAHFNSFITKLDDATDQQAQVVDTAHQVVEQRQQFFLEQQQKRKAIELLIEKDQLRRQAAEAKKEQQMLDEFATIQFFKKQNKR